MKRNGLLFFILLFSVSLFAGCKSQRVLDVNHPITLTLWHNYGGQMKETMDNMVDEFNETVGVENGIMLSVTSISSSSMLHDKLIMAANQDPGADTLPDITTANPKTAIVLAEKGLLINFEDYFTTTELEAYVPRFIEEGRLNGSDLYLFPIAKSTEVLYLNKTIFDRFAQDSDVRYADLRTFEGLAETAKLYHQWSDDQTPETLHDGKTFFHSDSLFNFTQVGCQQLGTDFIVDNNLKYTTPAFRHAWDTYYECAVKGYFSIYNGYATDLIKTGDIVCSTGSTAGVLFFDSVVTYADNTTEPLELMIMPYPIYNGGKKIAIQRGGGMMITKSEPAKEYAASIFLKWFTEAENNVHFVTSTGYLPVEKAAFNVMSAISANYEDGNIKTLLTAIDEMQSQYDFYIPPLYDGIDALMKDYEANLKQTVSESKKQYQELLTHMNSTSAFMEASNGKFEEFIK
ncbi:MAG: extracellular solute-binding protein [Firmicutes bacterium]|nr:extracellular solute-binding protein [Bacillota bacterium]